jgi:hypothetical protein
MRRLLQTLGLLLLAAIPAWGQGTLVTPLPALRNTGSGVVALPGALVTVCAAGDTTHIPCAAPLANTIWKDQALSVPQTNPFQTDVNGNYQFGVAAGTYTVTVSVGSQGYSYQLTVTCALTGSCTWTGNQIFNGNVTINNLTVNGTCSGSCGSSPLGSDNTWTNNNRFKGPDPWVDITTTGARAVAAAPSTTASCAGTTSITVASNTGFQQGDGVVIYGCGASETMSTPSAPTVTPGVTNTFTVPDAILTTDTSGSTTYLYKIVNRDKFGGLTLPSNATTITNGPATLGENQISISTLSLSGNTLTVVASSSEPLKAGELIHITGTSNEVFHLWAIISSITNGTTFVVNNFPMYSTAGISGTGGTLTYYTGNQLTWTNSGTTPWQTIVCASRPSDSGAYHVIGLTWPVNAIAYSSNTTFTDWGSTLTTKPRLPSYVSDSICTSGSVTNDYLSTTISNISGNTITVANAASQTASGQTFLQDSAPGITAAFTAAAVGNNAVVLIPGVGNIFFINSFLDLSSFDNIALRQEGSIQLDETLVPPGRWTGATTGHTNPPSSLGLSVPNVGNNGAWPGVYSTIIPFMENLGFSNGGNQSLDVLFDGNVIQGGIINNIIFGTGSTGDYSSIGLVVRGNPFFQSFKNLVFSNGPGNGGSFEDTTWTPMMYFARNNGSGNPIGVTVAKMENLQFNGRTFYCMDCFTIRAHDVYTQGNLLPTITVQAVTGFQGSAIALDGWLQNDTSGEAYLATLGGIGATVQLSGASGLSSNGSAGVGPLFTGAAPRSIVYIEDSSGEQVGPSAALGQSDPTPIDAFRNSVSFDSQSYYANDYQDAGTFNFSRQIMQNAGPISSNSGMFVPLATPILSVPSASAGGSIPDGAHLWCVNAVGFNGGWSKSSCQSFTTVGSNQTLQFNWTTVAGAAAYVLSRDNLQCLPDANVACGTTTTPVGTTTFTYSGAGVSEGSGFLVGKTATGDGLNGFNANDVFGLEFLGIEGTTPSGVVNADVLYADSSAHRWRMKNNNGSVTSVAGLADFATPPAIGNTTPAAGSFTTLSASSTVSGTGFSTYLASPPAIGGSAAAAGTFTTLTANTGLVFPETTAPSASSSNDVCYGDSTVHAIKCSLNNGSFIQMAQVTAIPLTVGSSTGNVFVAPYGLFICTASCTVTPPLPTAGVKFCVQNDVNTTGVITLGALGGSGQYGNSANTAYGTSGTGTLASGGAATDSVCIEGRDTTHYVITYHVGTWTAS